MVNYLEVNNLMDPDQHGSRQKRSCLSQLLEHQDEILKVLEEGSNVDVIYTDFEKAYEKIEHKQLLNKMKKQFKIRGKVLKWFESFLKNRKQQVLIEGTKSNQSEVKSGSVQGSVLGPVIFLMYIADLTKEVESDTKIFVDDAKVKKKIDNENDVQKLQSDIEKMFDWQTTNKMKFNGTKFQVLRYGNNKEVKENTDYFTDNMEDVIKQYSSLRDLGITMSDDARFDQHIENVVRKVRMKIGWIFRTFNTRRVDIMKQLWKTLLQCHVDYCSQLYKPGQAQEMQKNEKLFYDFISKLPELRENDYWTNLQNLKMLSQERRMERYRMISVWKCLEGLTPSCGLEAAEENPRLGRRCKVPLLRPGGRRAVQTLREQSFPINGAKLFNTLPKTIREIKRSQEDFKEALDRHLMTIPDQPRMGRLTPTALDQTTGRQSNSLLAWATTIRT